MKYLHKIQAISLIIAIALLWIPLGIEHIWNMTITSLILAINAIIEYND